MEKDRKTGGRTRGSAAGHTQRGGGGARRGTESGRKRTLSSSASLVQKDSTPLLTLDRLVCTYHFELAGLAGEEEEPELTSWFSPHLQLQVEAQLHRLEVCAAPDRRELGVCLALYTWWLTRQQDLLSAREQRVGGPEPDSFWLRLYAFLVRRSLLCHAVPDCLVTPLPGSPRCLPFIQAVVGVEQVRWRWPDLLAVELQDLTLEVHSHSTPLRSTPCCLSSPAVCLFVRS
jgi:hypothetical protein